MIGVLMPQLDTTWFISQLFWLCVCFFVLLFFMRAIFVPKISNILAHRQRKIDDYLVKANDLKEQAAQSLQKYQSALQQAKNEANLSLDASREEMKNYVEKKQNELYSKLNAKLDEGEKQLTDAKKKVMNDVKNISHTLVLDILPKLGIDKVSDDEVKEAVNDVLKN